MAPIAFCLAWLLVPVAVMTILLPYIWPYPSGMGYVVDYGFCIVLFLYCIVNTVGGFVGSFSFGNGDWERDREEVREKIIVTHLSETRVCSLMHKGWVALARGVSCLSLSLKLGFLATAIIAFVLYKPVGMAFEAGVNCGNTFHDHFTVGALSLLIDRPGTVCSAPLPPLPSYSITLHQSINRRLPFINQPSLQLLCRQHITTHYNTTHYNTLQQTLGHCLSSGYSRSYCTSGGRVPAGGISKLQSMYEGDVERLPNSTLLGMFKYYGGSLQ